MAGTSRTLALVAACLLGACGTDPTGGTGATGATDGRSADRPSTLVDTVPLEDRVVGPAPSSTVPDPPLPIDCTEEPVTIAERTLVARRQQAPSLGCMANPGPNDPESVCWATCADGTTFVDFSLDTTATPAVPAGGSVELDYVAVYRRPDGALDRRAETLVLTRSSGAWTIAEVRAVDLSADVDAARTAADGYLTALATGDYEGAAQLLAPRAPASTTDRDDLARLVDEGLLTAADVDAGQLGALARALAGWCELAACRTPDATRAEITADHRVHVLASYETDLGTFDVVLETGIDDSGPFVVGLPPELP